jgi:hypothetical protein
MDNSFISKDNVENIYEYINAYFVKNHNYNLNSYANYRKIIKKLTKTIFNSINNNEVYQNIPVNEFNDILLNKSIDFLTNDIKTKRTPQNINVKSSNSGLIESTLLDNNNQLETNVSEKKKKSNKRRKKKSNPEPANPTTSNDSSILNGNNTITINNNEEFLNDFDSFNQQLKEANKKIKDNFKQIISSGDTNFLPQTTMAIPDSVPSPSAPTGSVLTDDDVTIALSSNKMAFEKILEDKLEENSLADPTQSAYDSYTNSDISDMLTSVIFKQKDSSSANKLDSYEGEGYLPNLITPVGEEAPVQPLIYQNTGAGSERIDKKIITIDSGAGSGTGVLTDTVTNNGATSAKYWHKYRVDLQDTVRIDKLCDVYLRSIIVRGITSNKVCQYIVIDIEEFNIRNYSNNTNMRNKITVANSVSGTVSDVHQVLNVNYGGEDNYITTINPEKLSNLNITVTNQDNGNSETDAETFHVGATATNRIIFELEFRSRDERDDMIFEPHAYTN